MAKKGKTKAVETARRPVPDGTERRRKLTRKQNKLVAKKEASKLTVPTSFNILGQVFTVLRRHWKVLGGITLVYLILNIVLASGLSNVINNFNSVKDNLGAGHNFSDALHGFGSLLGNSTGASQSSSVFQSLLIILESLVVIWALRQLLADKKFSVKDAYYKSMAPLVPFLLVVIVILIQLLPVTLGSTLLALVSSAAISGFATFFMALVLIPLFAWSIYMISSSIFALYIVTLPDMQPRQALRSAKKLVSFRRLKIIRRLLFLPIFVLLVMAATVLPLILFAHFLVVPVFYLLSILIVLFVHTYLYSLYRGLLK